MKVHYLKERGVKMDRYVIVQTVLFSHYERGIAKYFHRYFSGDSAYLFEIPAGWQFN